MNVMTGILHFIDAVVFCGVTGLQASPIPSAAEFLEGRCPARCLELCSLSIHYVFLWHYSCTEFKSWVAQLLSLNSTYLTKMASASYDLVPPMTETQRLKAEGHARYESIIEAMQSKQLTSHTQHKALKELLLTIIGEGTPQIAMKNEAQRRDFVL